MHHRGACCSLDKPFNYKVKKKLTFNQHLSLDSLHFELTTLPSLLTLNFMIILLVIFVVDIRKASLLRIAHHFVASPDHQTVGYVHGVVTGALQDKSEIKIV